MAKNNGSTNGATNGATNGVNGYRELLLGKQAELLSAFRLKLESLVGPENPASEDLAQLLHDQHIAIKLNQIDLLQLQLVTTALQRLDGDGYGVCADCGDPISERRLRALPWTNRCIQCQERFGETQPGFRSRSRPD